MRHIGDRRFLHAATAAGAYLVLAILALWFTRFNGGAAYIWGAEALLVARLAVVRRRDWMPYVVLCGLAHAVAVAVAGAGPVPAVPLALISMGEAVLAAHLLRRMGGISEALDSVGQLCAIVLCVGVVAPAVGGLPAAAVISAATGTGFVQNWVAWYSGHALGTLTFGPVLTLFFSGEMSRWLAETSPSGRREAVLLLLLVGAVSLMVFVQDDAPLLFLPILPTMLATFRIGRVGAAASVVLIALIGGWLTLNNDGPVALMHAGVATHARFFQFYLAATVMTALPAAAELRRQRSLYDRLRDSEARYRLLADNSSDVVLNLARDGTICYASPSVEAMGGFDPRKVLGRNALDLVAEPDRAAVARVHAEALARPDANFTVEHRVDTALGERRWFESHMRGVRDEAGRVTGVVSALRDVTARKAAEAELERAAATDPLTGLANRRTFDAALEKLVSSAEPGCVALFDLDHFKAVNDRFGHDGGDLVLRCFAAAARGGVRDGDLVARLGGEEFGVLLPGATLAQAGAVCERVRAAVAAAPVRLSGGTARVTVSAGLAELGSHAGGQAAMRAADRALYDAKDAGRDRLALAA